MIFVSSCQKAPLNDNIEDFWKLVEYTTKHNQKLHKCEQIFYALQLQVIEISERGGNLGLPRIQGLYEYNQSTNKINIRNLYYYNENTQDFSTPDSLILHSFGLNDINTTFEVVSVDKRWMTLESDYAILKLKKF